MVELRISDSFIHPRYLTRLLLYNLPKLLSSTTQNPRFLTVFLLGSRLFKDLLDLVVPCHGVLLAGEGVVGTCTFETVREGVSQGCVLNVGVIG